MRREWGGELSQGIWIAIDTAGPRRGVTRPGTIQDELLFQALLSQDPTFNLSARSHCEGLRFALVPLWMRWYTP